MNRSLFTFLISFLVISLSYSQQTHPSVSAAENAAFKEPEMVFVEGGTFLMETDIHSVDNKIHKFKLNSFSIGKYEITVEQYLFFCQETGSHLPEWLEVGNDHNVETGKNDTYQKLGYSRNKAKNLPIAGISWDDANAYCQWLSRKSNKNYRLPTEVEWEYAARGGNKSKNYHYSGSDTLIYVAWCGYVSDSDYKPHPVGQKQSNEIGVYDMTGNVWEWCGDFYHSWDGVDFTKLIDMVKGDDRMIRGASWYSWSQCWDVRFWRNSTRDLRNSDLGFRIVLAP